jgi:hypothetical protein
MRASFSLFVVFAQFANSTVAAADQKPLTTPADVMAALKNVLAEHYPKTEMTLTKDAFSAKANAMEFTLHRILRDGRITEETYKSEGPKHVGFIIRVSYRKGRYAGPLVTPQTLRNPY